MKKLLLTLLTLSTFASAAVVIGQPIAEQWIRIEIVAQVRNACPDRTIAKNIRARYRHRSTIEALKRITAIKGYDTLLDERNVTVRYDRRCSRIIYNRAITNCWPRVPTAIDGTAEQERIIVVDQAILKGPTGDRNEQTAAVEPGAVPDDGIAVVIHCDSVIVDTASQLPGRI